MTPDEVKPYEPGMAAHMMDVLGHAFRCAPPQKYIASRPMPNWPARRPLVQAIPMAVMAERMQAMAEQNFLDLSSRQFCGALQLGDVMES